jgi:hypothetical protein
MVPVLLSWHFQMIRVLVAAVLSLLSQKPAFFTAKMAA